MTREEKKELVPVWEKALLTVEEASAYSGIGGCKLREITDEPECDFVFWVGNRRMFKRKKFEEYLERTFSI
ncbi:MAG: transposase [Parasporobacterium sp.]|nr:transposase [Parasporobacterium sp.]